MSRAETQSPDRTLYRHHPHALLRSVGSRELLVLWPSSPHGVLQLNGTALELWHEFSTPTTLGDVAERVAARHGTGPDQVVEDVRRAVAELVDAGVIEAHADGP